MFQTRVYYSNGKVHYEGYSKSKTLSNRKQIDHDGIFMYNLEGHVRRYDEKGRLIQTIRLHDGKRVPLERMEMTQSSTKRFSYLDDECPFLFLTVEERYSGEVDQYGKPCGKGVCFHEITSDTFCQKKVFFVGHFQNGQRNGYGTLYNLESKIVYQGEWKNGRPHGIGISFYGNGSISVFGTWERGLPSLCLVYNEHGNFIHCGPWENFNGNGFLFENKTGNLRYIGEFQHGRPNGKGTFIHINDDEWYGKGTTILGPYKEYFTGYVDDGKLSGYVVQYHSPDNNCIENTSAETFKVFEGFFEHGERHGFGIDYQKNYVGMFKNNVRHGYGTLLDSETHVVDPEYDEGYNIIFQGEFKNGMPSKGTMFFENGKIMYKGSFLHDDKRTETFEDDFSSIFGFYHGFGKSYYPSGKLCYEGQWEYSLQVGEGTFYSEDGIEIRKNKYQDGAWIGYGIYYGNSRKEKVLYNGLLRNGLPHGEGVLFEYDNEIDAIESVFVGDFFNGHYYDFEMMFNTRNEVVFQGKCNENGDFVEGIQFLNDEHDRSIQWKHGKIFDEEKHRTDARQRLYLSQYLETGKPSQLSMVSKSICKKMYRQMFGTNSKTSKKSLLRQMIHYRKQQNRSSTTDSSRYDLFGNEIVTPVTGNDGQIYDVQSMMKLFSVNKEHEYTTIKYQYDTEDKRVPHFPNTGFSKPLSGFYLDHDTCRTLSLVPRQQGMTMEKIRFFTACEKGDLEIVKESIENGIDINETSSNGMTSLMYACQNGHVELVKYLVRHGVDVNERVDDITNTHLSVDEVALQKSENDDHSHTNEMTTVFCQKVDEKDVFYGKYVQVGKI